MADEPDSETNERVYAGDDITVADLAAMVAKGAAFLPVQVTDLESVKASYGAVPNRRPSTLLILESFSPSYFGPEAAQVTYYEVLHGFKRNMVDLAKAHKLRLLTGRQGRDMVARWQEHRETSFTVNRISAFSGADPEVFIETPKRVIPAFEFLPSKKEGKTGYGGSGVAGTYYWDGFQAEFNTQPGACLAYHGDSLYAGLFTLADRARAYDSTARLSMKSVVSIPMEVIESAREEHVAFGCMPSLNAYGLTAAQALDGRATPLRFAGGHIHLGVGRVARPEDIVKAMDAVLGVACVSLFASWDNPIRRQFYGLPGEYRLPAHGLEYRTLSNAWLAHPAIYNMVFDLARRAKDLGQQGLLKLWKAEERETIETILNCDVVQARKILDRNKRAFKTLLSCLGSYQHTLDRAYDVWANGMESILKTPDDIEANWGLKGGWEGHVSSLAPNWSSALHYLEKGQKV